MKIGLIELPRLKLLDGNGRNFTAWRTEDPLLSKMVLGGSLMYDFEIELFNLKRGSDQIDLGTVQYGDVLLRKIVQGYDWMKLPVAHCDVWGVTVSFLQEREIACHVIRHLSSSGATVVVGGSDALAEPDPYLEAGATLVVTDKSGGSNVAAIKLALGLPVSEPFSVKMKQGPRHEGKPRLHPNDWKLPGVDYARQVLGREGWDVRFPEHLAPVGAMIFDQGCDRKCDFCQTPTYGLGYQAMSPSRALEWVQLLKNAGAKSLICGSDQFLGRILWPEGRSDILKIVSGLREIETPVFWSSGLELAKATLGRGFKNGDTRPDNKLVDALWGWNGKVGCAQSYIPAERPHEGTKSYAKLLDWREHVVLLETIATTGVPELYYGIIIGLKHDSNDSMAYLLDAVVELKERVRRVNPRIRFRATPFSVRPIPGTSLSREMHRSGLLKFTDPAILGGFMTACADTEHMSFQDVSRWQMRITETLSDDNDGLWQGF